MLRCPPLMTSRSLAPGRQHELPRPAVWPLAPWPARRSVAPRGHDFRAEEGHRAPVQRRQAVTDSAPDSKLRDLLDTHGITI